jgi:hypothetical protein
MKVEIDVNDDMFDELFRSQLIDHYFMVSGDLNDAPHPEDEKWMRPVKDALYTLLTLYYSTQTQRDEFLNQVKEFEDGR